MKTKYDMNTKSYHSVNLTVWMVCVVWLLCGIGSTAHAKEVSVGFSASGSSTASDWSTYFGTTQNWITLSDWDAKNNIQSSITWENTGVYEGKMCLSYFTGLLDVENGGALFTVRQGCYIHNYSLTCGYNSDKKETTIKTSEVKTSLGTIVWKTSDGNDKTLSISIYDKKTLYVYGTGQYGGVMKNISLLSKVSFVVWIPEAVSPTQATFIATENIKQQGGYMDITTKFRVNEAVSAEDFEVSVGEKSGTSAGSFSIISKTLDNSSGILTVVVRYTTENSSAWQGSYSGKVTITPKVTYEGYNDQSASATVSGEASDGLSNPGLTWILPKDENEHCVLYVGDEYTKEKFVFTQSAGELTYTTTNSNVISIANGVLMVKSVGDATLTVSQAATATHKTAGPVEITVQVKKRTPQFVFSPYGTSPSQPGDLYPGTPYNRFISVSTADPHNNMPTMHYMSSDNDLLTIDANGTAQTKAGMGKVGLTVTSEETKEWNAANASYEISIIKDPRTLPLYVTQDLLKNSQFLTSEGGGSAEGKEEKLQIGVNSNSKHTTSAIISFIGVPSKITFTATPAEWTVVALSSGSFSYQQGYKDNNGDYVWSSLSGSGAILNENTRYVKFTHVGPNYGYIEDLCIASASTYKVQNADEDIDISSLTINREEGSNAVATADFGIRYVDIKSLTLSPSAGITVDKTALDYHDGLGIGTNGKVRISVSVDKDVTSGTITITGENNADDALQEIVLNINVETTHGRHYAKATAQTSSGRGTIYVGTTNVQLSESAYSTSVVAVNECAATAGASDELPFYFYAKSEPGYGFKEWVDAQGNIISNAADYSENVSATSTDADKPTSITRIANFAESCVLKGMDTTLPILTSLTGSVTGEVEFTSEYVAAATDLAEAEFVGDHAGFTIEGTPRCEQGKVYVTVRYTGTGLVAQQAATLQLQGKYQQENIPTAHITVPINITPTFSMPADYSFGAVDVTTPTYTSLLLSPTATGDFADKNITWHARIDCTDANVFAVTSETSSTGFYVTYSPKENKTYTAQLYIYAVYTDEQGNTAQSPEQSCTISGSVNAPTETILRLDKTEYTFPDIYGTMTGTLPVALVCNNVTVTETDITWSGNDEAGVFAHTATINAFAGTITITAHLADAPTEQSGPYTATLTVRGKSKDDDKDYTTSIKVTATFMPKIKNTLAFCMPETWYVDMKDWPVIKDINSDAPITITSSASDILMIDNTRYTASGNSNGRTGEVTITVSQPATDKYEEASLTLTNEVVKHTPVFTFTYGQQLWKNTTFADFVKFDNTDEEADFTVSLSQASDASYLSVSGKSITTRHTVGTYNIHITAPGTPNYAAVDQDVQIEVVKAPQHVEATLTKGLFNNTEPLLYPGTKMAATFTTDSRDVVWASDDVNAADSIWLGHTWSNSGCDTTGTIVNNQFAFTQNNAYITFRFMGVPDRVHFSIAVEKDKYVGSVELQCSTDGNTWKTIGQYSSIGEALSVSLEPDVRYIQFQYTEDSQTQGWVTIQNLVITEFSGVTITPAEVEFVRGDNGSYEPQTVIIKAANWGGSINLANTNPNFQLTYDDFTGNGEDELQKRTATVSYTGVGAASDLFTLTCSNGKIATLHVVVNPSIPAVITYDGRQTEILTGTEHPTSNSFPYKVKTQVDVSAAFAGKQAIFDRLYIFGLTTNTDENVATDNGVSYHAIDVPNTKKASNAKTPCYIYDREGTDKYRLVQTIPNMNVADKPIGQITANGQKLYFTGYCPYGSCGYTKDDNGIIDIKGDAGSKIDLYFDNFDMRPRPKKKSGTTIRPDTIQINLRTEMYLTGSGAAVVFQSTSKSTSNPFTPSIHLRGDNVISGTQAAYVIASLSSYKKEAGQHSSPLHILATDKDQCTTLNVDDIWQKADGTGTERTNGSLQFNKYARNMPSIDLGNANSVLNFNGGQIHLQNSTPQSAQYISTFAIAYRTYSASVSIITATMYGLGNDQPGGTINFNDGSIYCTPLASSDVDKYGTYYWDLESMKYPQNTKINGGSYHCKIYACSAATNKGASPTNQYGDAVVPDTIPAAVTEPYQLATITFPDDLTNQEEGDTYKGETLAAYYQRNGVHYKYESLAATADGKVVLMLPSKYVGKSAQVEVTVTPWYLCSPSITAGTATGTGSSASLSFGGKCTIKTDKSNANSRFAWAELDDYIVEAVEDNYKSPEANASLTLEKVDGEAVRYQTVENTSSYAFEDEMYVFKPIPEADDWMLFTPPFDVSEVYVLESYPEEELKKIGTTGEADLIAQAKASMDMFYFLCSGIYSSKDGVVAPFDNLYNNWVTYERKKDTESGWYTSGTYNLRGKRLLEHFTGSNWDADYYLYASEEPWTYDGTKFTNGWHYAPAATEVQHGTKTHKVLMHKGQVYAMNFPFMYRGYRNQTGNYDYWTGKYLIFKGLGPQTIEGSDYISTMEQAFTEAGKAVLRGNATFADLSIDGVSNAFTLYDDGKTKTFVSASSGIDLEPMQGFLVANVPTPQGMCVKSISMQTGKVTFEADAPTSVPTVGGDHTLLVTKTDDGIRIAVRTPQHIRVYASDGALVFDGHVETSVDVTHLSAGIYVIRGEHEVQKIMVQ